VHLVHLPPVPRSSPPEPKHCFRSLCVPLACLWWSAEQPEGSLELLGVNTKGILARAAVRSVPVFRIAMGEHDEDKQVGIQASRV